jgi:hypothetical protein
MSLNENKQKQVISILNVEKQKILDNELQEKQNKSNVIKKIFLDIMILLQTVTVVTPQMKAGSSESSSLGLIYWGIIVLIYILASFKFQITFLTFAICCVTDITYMILSLILMYDFYDVEADLIFIPIIFLTTIRVMTSTQNLLMLLKFEFGSLKHQSITNEDQNIFKLNFWTLLSSTIFLLCFDLFELTTFRQGVETTDLSKLTSIMAINYDTFELISLMLMMDMITFINFPKILNMTRDLEDDNIKSKNVMVIFTDRVSIKGVDGLSYEHHLSVGKYVVTWSNSIININTTLEIEDSLRYDSFARSIKMLQWQFNKILRAYSQEQFVLTNDHLNSN